MERDTVYEREVFDVTLVIEVAGTELDSRMNLGGMPESPCLKFGTFKEMPAQRLMRGNTQVEVKSYRTTARALAPGSVPLAPTLHVNLLHVRPSIVGSVRMLSPASVAVQPRTIVIRPLPPTPSDISFSGAVGVMRLDVTVSPTNLAPGELVTVTSRVIGRGSREDILPPRASPGGAFRVYDPKPLPDVETDPPERRFEQILVPQTREASIIPAIAFTYFDPSKARYETIRAGPFALHFRERETVVETPYRPTVSGSGDDSVPGQRSPWRTAWEAASPSARLAVGGVVVIYWMAAVFGAGYIARRARRGTVFGLLAVVGAGALFLAASVVTRDRLLAKPPTQTARPEPARLVPSHGALTLFTVPADVNVTVLETCAAWVKIEYQGNRGWVPSSAVRKALR
jgi:hypothetical protein